MTNSDKQTEESVARAVIGCAAFGEDQRCETDSVTAVELHRNRRILYFSDGTLEESSDSDNENEGDVPDRGFDINLNENEMPVVPRLKRKASRMGSNILAGIDYVGGGLAAFLGITTPKYKSEYKQTKSLALPKTEVNDSNNILSQISTQQNEIRPIDFKTEVVSERETH